VGMMSKTIKLEKLKNWKFLGAFLGILGGVQFIVITIVAMFFYPGGYSFFDNFFSDLGLTRSSSNGQQNIISFVLFIIAMTVAGIVWIPFWLSLRTVFTETKKSRYTSTLGTIIGLISCPFLVLIAYTPYDILLELHILAVQIFFLLFAFAIIIYSITILLDKDYASIYAYIGFAMAVLLILYTYVFPFNPAFQKVTVYVLISWVIIKGYKLWNMLELN